MNLLTGLIELMVIGLSGWKIGHFLSRDRWNFKHPALNLSFSTGLGILCLSHLIFVLVTLRLASRSVLSGLLVLLGIIALYVLAELRKLNWKFPELNLASRLILGLYTVWMLLYASLPASLTDELVYHLEAPQRILEAHGWVFFKDNVYAYFPQLAEMMDLLCLGTSGETAARLFHVGSGGLLFLALYGFSRQFLTQTQALFSVLILATTPTFMSLLPTTYVDILYSFFTFLCSVALVEYLKSNAPQWIIAAGLMAGAAMATKYTGIQFVILLAIITLLEHFIQSKIERRLILQKDLKYLMLMGGVAFLIAMPYFLRNAWQTGWPLFPFQIFHLPLKPEINWDTGRAEMLFYWFSQFGIPKAQQTNLWYLLLTPILVFIRGQFNSPEYFDGVLGPVFLLIPVALWKVFKSYELKYLIRFVILFLYYWASTTKQARFLFPILPILAFLLSYGLFQNSKAWLKIAVAAGILFNVWMGMKEMISVQPWKFWTGKETRESYLSRRLYIFPMYERINRTLKDTDKIYMVHMKNLGYLMKQPWEADFVFDRYRLENMLKSSPTPDEFDRFFKEKQVTYIAADFGLLSSQQLGIGSEAWTLLVKLLRQKADLVFEHFPYVLMKLKTA